MKKNSINKQKFHKIQLEDIISLGLAEDIGDEDITTKSIITDDKKASFIVKAKQDFILCGIDIFKQVFYFINPSLKINSEFIDGNKITKGQVFLEGKGQAASILKAERVALNLLQYLSGIATKTKQFSDLCKDSNIQILDTRKTLPLYRELAKYAVTIGGGYNHRMGLYDAILIKENHITAAGGVTEALKLAKSSYNNVKIEIECEDIRQVEAALLGKADVIMLDNMNLKQIKEAILLINGAAKIEVSGNMTREKIEELKDLAIDYISVGEITHTVGFCDISLIISL